MKKYTILRGLAALALFTCLTSCQDEEFGYTFEDVRKGQYSRVFDDKFGKPDPNHTWSMAKNFIATASLNIEGDAQLSVYSSDPRRTVGSKLLGLFDLQNGQMSSSFTASSAFDNAFIIVKQDGKIAFEGYCSIQDSLLQISEDTRVRKAETRATTSGLSIGDKWFTHVVYDKDATWDGKTYYWSNKWNPGAGYIRVQKDEDEWFLYFASSLDTPFRKIAKNNEPTNAVCGYGQQAATYFADDHSLFQPSGFYWPNVLEYNGGVLSIKWKDEVSVRARHDGAYYYINGNTQTTDVEWTIGDCKDLFWMDNAFFKEREDYRGATKRALYESQGVSVSDMEKGVIYTTSTDNSEISVPMMFGATLNENILGYYYYTDNEDPRDVNRYILYEDAKPCSNITVNGTSLSDNMRLQKQGDYQDDYIVRCTNRKLVYFDKNGEGSFSFPKGVHIGFFIIRKAHSASVTCETGWAYSDPELNFQSIYQNTNQSDGIGYNIDAWYYRTSSDSYDKSRGNVKAITWKYGDRIFVGFGDDSGDFDLNDFVFWVDGNFNEEPPIIITKEEKEHNSWLFACEDLGGTFDYDFNDVVWDVYQEYTKTTEITKDKRGKETKKEVIKYDDIKVRLLAAGGILPLHIMYDGKDLGEVHQCYGQLEANEYTQVNVGNKVERNPVVLETISANNKEMDLNTIKNKLKVQVRGQEGNSYFIDLYFKDTHYMFIDNTPSRTNRPQILTLDGDWEWPQEGKPIDTVYPNFRSWVASALFGKWDGKKEGLYTSRDL